MRIVLSNASAKWGGVHVVTRVLAAGLQARGHEVEVFCRPGSLLAQHLRNVAPLRPIVHGADLSPLGIARALGALRRFHPDVVLTMMEKDVRLTAPAAALLRIPVVVRRANDRPWKARPHYRVLYGWLPAMHVANSEATRRTLLASAPWLSPARVRVIRNGIDLRPHEPAPLGLPASALAIGFVARFEERKGILDLAAAWPEVAASLPDAHLLLIGSGPLEQRVRAQLGVSPRVHWLGHRSDARAVMAALDLVAMPSHWEGFGLVAVEAMAAGAVVVASDASSLPEIIRHGEDGWLVPPREPAALAHALIALGSDPALRARLAAAARERVRADFAADVMVARYEALCAEVAGL